MTVSTKLKTIQKILGLSQEKLARELEVSFATLNSWINSKSEPREKALERLADLYAEVTGEKSVPEDILNIKKGLVEQQSKKHKNILKKVSYYPDIYKYFVQSLTYNTNSIEGSTMTENETAAILFDNVSLPNKNLIEILEVKNHQAALRYVLKYLRLSRQIDEEFIQKLHGILMNSIRDDAGFYRRHPVRIIGSNIATANYVRVPELMKGLVSNINIVEKNFFKQIAEVHARFEQIHPFSDGNGRIGRLIMVAMLLRQNYPPAVIKQERKQLYYTYLNKSQQTGDTSLLENFILDAILESFNILKGR